MTAPSADATVLALDLGGTQIRAAVVRADGTRIGRAASVTPLSGGPAAIVGSCSIISPVLISIITQP